MNTPAANAAAPELAIRTKPPTPKRLSRKVLVGGALMLGSIIAFALTLGLSQQEHRYGIESETSAANAGPPESIQQAAGEYDASTLGADPFVEEDAELAPPQGPIWEDDRGPNMQTNRSDAAPTPQQSARAAPILFEAAPRAEVGDDNARLNARLTPPRSAYEVLSGSVIPAALVTELNSDRPGRVIAQVTAPIFDTISGNHLLIPQGARLIGVYDNGVRYGDQRLLLVWERLILPNGWSIALGAMPGGDVSGAAGIADRTDQHLDRLAGAVALSAIVSVIANNAEEDEDASLAQNVAGAAAQEAARTGARIIDREMSVRPTLRVRAGAPVRVLVTRDIQLRPYRAPDFVRR